MAQDYYRYSFQPAVPCNHIEVAFALALLSCESIHGESQTRLDAGYGIDAVGLRLVIDAGTPVGRDLNRLFVRIIRDEFGEESFKVERLLRGIAPPSKELQTGSPSRGGSSGTRRG